MSICVQQLAKRPAGSDFQLFNVTPCWCEGSATPSKAAEARAGEGRSPRPRSANKSLNTKSRGPEMDGRCCSHSRFSRSSACACGKTPLTDRLCETAKHNVTHQKSKGQSLRRSGDVATDPETKIFLGLIPNPNINLPSCTLPRRLLVCFLALPHFMRSMLFYVVVSASVFDGQTDLPADFHKIRLASGRENQRHTLLFYPNSHTSL